MRRVNMRLDLGGGKVPAPGHINIDIMEGADIVWDLNKGLPDKIFPVEGNPVIEGIRCHQVLEHLNTIIPLLNDCYAVMKEGAELEISTPYALSPQCWADPTHKRGFTELTFSYFIKNSPFEKEKKEYGIIANFSKLKTEILDGWNVNATLTK